MKTLLPFVGSLWSVVVLAGFADAAPPVMTPKALMEARQKMVDEEIVAAGVKDPRVIESMRSTPRHEFIPSNQRQHAYFDMALPIGDGQTISPPFVVAYMTEQLHPQPTDKVLEIGTGSGYQAAILSPLVKDVYSIEIVKPLGERAGRTLKRLKYENVHTMIGDGYQGWPEHAPFDKIIVTCSPEKVPPKLVEQLREGGRMVVPVGERYKQTLFLFEKQDGKLTSIALLPTLFVPMTGKAEAGREVLPDPGNPAIVNGSFEELLEDGEQPSGWHYARQLNVVTEKTAPAGEHYVTFSNKEPGRGSQALQGLAIDGRRVPQIEISLRVKGSNLQPGQSPDEMPVLAIIFYDENRGQLGNTFLGPWRGTFDWQEVSERIRIPAQTREAIIRLGLLGATGEVSFDDIKMTVVK